MIKSGLFLEATVDKVGRLVIPKPIRMQINLIDGGKVYLAAIDEGVLIIPESKFKQPS